MATSTYSNINFSDVGGNDSFQGHFKEMKNSEELSVLLHGPTGCGKSLLAHSIAGEYQLPLLSYGATELAEGNIQHLFHQATKLAPCILLIENFESITVEGRIATEVMDNIFIQLATSINDLKCKSSPVLVICTTTRPDLLDKTFRTTCFNLEHAVGIPNKSARESILQALCQKVQLAENVSLSAIADLTPGYVGSDLKRLITITNSCALHREYNLHSQSCVIDCEKTDEGCRRKKVLIQPEEISRISVSLTQSDFQEAMTQVKQMTKQDYVNLVPNTTWDDIGGLDNIRKELNLCIMERIRRPELYQAIGMTSVGVLLVGPPGCGKTSVVRAVANETGINFLCIYGAELLNKHVGESEKYVRDLFEKADSLAPCVIFFDDIDSMCPKWSPGSEEGSASRVTNQLLLEMSGLKQRNDVYIIAATNKLDCLDPALLHTGRMDKIIYVGLPSPEGRVEILKALTKNGTRPKMADDIDLDCIGKDRRCDGFSGADLGNLVEMAKLACLQHIIDSTDIGQAFEVPVLNKTHLETAFENISASVNA